MIAAAAGLLAPAVWAANGSTPVHSYDLMHKVQGQVFADGSLALWQETVAGSQLLMQMSLPLPKNHRRVALQDTVFAGLFSEGDPGGHRGFARDADDDGDGLVDEDRADGRDNDGDDLVDEDFAAISDEMLAVDHIVAGRHFHLEAYHWSYCHLKAALLLSCQLEDQTGRKLEDSLVLQSASETWRQVDFQWRIRGGTGVSDARSGLLFAAAIAHPENPEELTWLGISPLPEAEGQQTPGPRATLEDGRMEIPLRDGRIELAIGVAPTLLQLRYNLAAAHAVHRGAHDWSGSKNIAWIVPPLCPVSLKGAVPPVRWEQDRQNWRLLFDVQPGRYALLDPDLFQIGDSALGPPVRIAWRADDTLRPPAASERPGQSTHNWSLPWRRWTLEHAALSTTAEQDPYDESLDLLHHAGQGELVFEFAGQPPRDVVDGGWTLSGAGLSGRPFRIEVPARQPEAPVVDESAEQDSGNKPDARVDLRNGSQAPMLSPELLENFPNPFRMQTNIRYRIPTTVGEGFVWEEGHDPGLDPLDPIPYQSTQPTVSLKVYSISGQEIATLYEGALGIGQYEESWDGTDASGRPVASGTYFCKLQIEGWAVTKRLVFLR